MRLRLATVFTTLLVIIVTLGMAGLGAMSYSKTRDAMTADLSAQAEQAAKRLSGSLAASMWNMENAKAEEIIAAEMDAREVSAVLAEEAGGKAFAGLARDAAGKPLKTQALPKAKDQLAVTRDIQKGDKVIGKVHVAVTEAYLKERLDALLTNTVLGVVVVDVILLVLMAVMVRVILVNPMNRLTAFANEAGEGNLDAMAPVLPSFCGELGSLRDVLAGMVQRLKGIIADVKSKEEEAQVLARDAQEARDQAVAAGERAERAREEGMAEAARHLQVIVRHTSAASEELMGRTRMVLEGANDQQHRISDAATAIEEMNATIAEMARIAGDTAEHGKLAMDQASLGNETVAQAVAAIGKVNDMTGKLTGNMGGLARQAEDIGRIITVINDIADQTNLLALNAAIEAARVGGIPSEGDLGYSTSSSLIRQSLRRKHDGCDSFNNLAHLPETCPTWGRAARFTH